MANKRRYNGQSALFIIVAIVLLVVLDRTFFTEKKVTPPEPPQIIEVQQQNTQPPTPAPPVVLGEQAKPEFASARNLSTGQIAVPQELPLWQKNAVASNVLRDKPRVALIIDDMGLDVKHSRMAMDLPGPLTLSFMPYAKNLRAQTSYAISNGHELMVHVPMQPENAKLDAGPKVLKVGQTPEQFGRILNDDLDSFGGYVGINNHMGSKMTQDHAGMALLMTELKKRGLLFVDSKTIPASVAVDEAKKAGVPFAVREVFVDDEEARKPIEGALQHIEKLALSKGLAIAIAHPRAETVEALRAWLPTLKAKGIELVPVSAVVTVPAATESPR
ncbi:MAG: putative periplasmic protein [Micavibrio sp.]|nr:putative periplasmic protein [Micavibrio sp.]